MYMSRWCYFCWNTLTRVGMTPYGGHAGDILYGNGNGNLMQHQVGALLPAYCVKCMQKVLT